MESNLSPFVVTSERRSHGPLSSLSVCWKKVGHKAVYGPYDRPPFPIIIDRPTVQDVFSAMRFSDFFMGATIYGAGTLASFFASRRLPMISQRLLAYHGLSHLFFCLAAIFTFVVPYRRLTGFWDNGLRWRKPEDRLNKWDATSHFERSTGWSRFRVNTEE